MKFLSILFLALLPTPVYDSNPNHIWNRLYEAFCVRHDESGAAYGVGEIDALLWIGTNHLLVSPSHRQAIAVLDEFLRTHAENQIHDPLKKTLLQHNLWAVFDWSASRNDNYPLERRELQTRLAEVLYRLALSESEIKSLPANYAAAVASRTIADHYNDAEPEKAFLPPDLLQPKGPWVRITANFEPLAPAHVFQCSGRSSFFIFIHLPQGRAATINYLKRLWEFENPWIGSEMEHGDNPNLPQFPEGTQVALLRQMNVFGTGREIVGTPITESLQIRVYRSVPSRIDENRIDRDWDLARKEQSFYEIRLDQRQLLAMQAGGLHAFSRDAKEFATFSTQGRDPFEHHGENEGSPILQRCVACHSAPGIHSLQSRAQLMKPNRGQVDPQHGNDPDREPYGPWWQDGRGVAWKAERYDWGLLNGLWPPPGKDMRGMP